MILMFEKKIDMHIEQKKEIVEKIINNNLTISEIPDCYKYDYDNEYIGENCFEYITGGIHPQKADHSIKNGKEQQALYELNGSRFTNDTNN